MGTNFYLYLNQPIAPEKSLHDEDMIDRHIGKRSAAGWYCWDCRRTLCPGGESKVHTGRQEWPDRCPVCGALVPKESLTEGAAGRELGFNRSKPQRKTGVASCSSFTWGIPKEVVMMKLAQNPAKAVVDEYGRIFSRAEFLDILEECPIQKELIGQSFS